MRLIGSPSALRWLARRSWPDVPASARERLELVSLVERLTELGHSVSRACHLVGVPRANYYRWRARLAAFGVNGLRDGRAGSKRRRHAPVRSLITERVWDARQRYPLGKEKLRVVLAREGIMVSSSTIHRVLTGLFERGALQRIGYAQRSTGKRRRAAKRAHAQRKASGVKPLATGQLVQIDTLHEGSLLGRPRYQFTAQDPTTKWLHAELYSRASSGNAASFLRGLLASAPFEISSVQVDNGSEFKGRFEAACQARNIAECLIPPASPRANGMIERAQRTFREEHYAYEPACLNLEQERAALAAYVHYYNHIRPHQALDYQTPAEYAKNRNLHKLSQLD